MTTSRPGMGEDLPSSGASPTGETRLAAVIGWPVRHSQSPALHNAAFRARGLDWIYLALPVPPGSAPAAVAAMDTLGIEGLSVTMPHKAAVVASVDRCTADSTALGAVNCVFRDAGALVGDNTDGPGFIGSLRDAGVDPAGMRTLVVGAGGAARAVVRSLAGAGASRVAVHNRGADRAETAAALAGSVGAVATDDDWTGADLVVQATPVGMGDSDVLAFDVDRLADRAVVADLVYHPAVTPVLAAAAGRGLTTIGGIGMLVHQAALAFTHWTGEPAPLPEMRAALSTPV